MTSPSGDAVTPRENTRTGETDPSPCAAAGPTALALPQRIGGILIATTPGRATQQPAGPELLRRVLDGLKQI